MGTFEEVEDGNNCAVCKKPAESKCKGCKEVNYCTRNCQKTHWKRHKNECKLLPYKVEKSAELGRFLVATRDIKKGDAIFKEAPLVLGPVAQTLPVCLACYELVDGTYKCKKSGWPLCGPQCEAKVAHNPEVVIPSQTEGLFEIESYEEPCYLYECVTPLRALLLQKTAPKRFKKIMSLESHLESRKGTEAWQTCQDRVIDVMKKTLGVMVFEVLYPQLDFKDERIQELVGIFETNSIEIRLGQTEVHGLYEMGSMMEHSCVPNINMSFDEKFHLTATAGRDIEKGEHLSIMYTHCLWGTWARRDHLINYKKFWCSCKRCSDPSELGTEFSTILRNGKKLRPKNPLEPNTSWVSTDGTNEVSSIDVQNDMTRIAAELSILQIKGTVPEFREFLEKYSKELHPCHYHMVAAKHNLLQMLGRVEGFVIQDMPMKDLKEKEHLCRELVELCKKLDPSVCRLQIYLGVSLYELHFPLLQYGKRAWESGDMSTEEFRKSLMEPRDLLIETASVLRDETNTKLPEGQLRMQVRETLTQLEGFMKTVGCDF
ncbi:SET domain-containing protein SmydA-8-like isoform X2 [Tigriopus californicus]|nr:SET domain-containing protein SmydA-8-like isoform X1 [Tigriopus californicus]XP_059097588.1 SET domain-containing protein SmydA-8-like isoform X2 [Tigriopus californicus]